MTDCEKCLAIAQSALANMNVGAQVRAPMILETKEIALMGRTETIYRYTLKCPSCGATKVEYGYPCPFCNGEGFFCHIHYGTTCGHCHSSGYNRVPEDYVKWLEEKETAKH